METTIAGHRGQRLHRPKKSKLERVLEKDKDEIIGYCVDNPEDYSPDWLAEEVKEIWWEDFEEAGIDPTVEEIENVVARWDDEITDEIKLSYEPTALEEAKCDIMKETMKGFR